MRSYAIILLALSGLAAVTAHSYSDDLHARGFDEYESLSERGLDSFEEVPQLLARAIDEHHLQLQTREAEAYHDGYAAGLEARDADGADLALPQQSMKRDLEPRARTRTTGRCFSGHTIVWDTKNGPRPSHCPKKATRGTGTCLSAITWNLPGI
ncbi:hypothetical protein MMC17_002916 [Xylographa soralifera]|nr:hypothetical protein [Xylographa soralifera]